MKKLITAAILGGLLAAPVLAADVGVSINIGEPDFFGQIQIGNMPPPMVVMPQPVIVNPIPVMEPPIYLRVPPEQIRDWHRYCHAYHACEKRVLFVQDGWYRDVYAPRYREEHRDRHEMERDREREHERHGHEERFRGGERRHGDQGENY